MPDGARVEALVAARDVRLDVTLPGGVVTAVVGPNGAGKSTLIQLLAGQLRPDEGRVEVAGVRVADRKRWVPPHRRSVALLEQRPLLFPHLTVAQNVAFGPRAKGQGPAAALRRASAELDAVGAAELAGRRPSELSGGQAQRVAIARALATDPAVVLLDEPLAALDVDSAAALRTLLARRLAGRTAVWVTHDPVDLWTLAGELVLLEAGRLAAQGPLEALLTRPPSAFLAGLGGLNRLLGVATGPDTLRVGGEVVVGVTDQEGALRAGEPAMALFEPAAVGLYADPPHGSPRNEWPVVATALEPRGPLVRVRLRLPDGQALAADVTARSAAALSLAEGRPLIASVKAAQVDLHPAR